MSEVFAGSELSLAGSNLSYVIVAAVIALVALGFAAGLVRTVLATGKGTQKMQDIAGAVQEGASAYLTRQFKTLGVFVIIAVVLLFLLPVNEGGIGVDVGIGCAIADALDVGVPRGRDQRGIELRECAWNATRVGRPVNVEAQESELALGDPADRDA